MKTYFNVYQANNQYIIEESEKKPDCTARHVLTEIFHLVADSQEKKAIVIKRLNAPERKYAYLSQENVEEIKTITCSISNEYIRNYESKRWRIGKIWDKIKKLFHGKTEKRKIGDLQSQIYEKLKPVKYYASSTPFDEFFEWLKYQPEPKPSYQDWLKIKESDQHPH